MEWVETTGRSIDEAKEAALDELGVDERDAEFEVLEEPKVGLFGRVRSEGRIRARIRPTTPRAKEDRRDRRRRSKSADEQPGGAPDVEGDVALVPDPDSRIEGPSSEAPSTAGRRSPRRPATARSGRGPGASDLPVETGGPSVAEADGVDLESPESGRSAASEADHQPHGRSSGVRSRDRRRPARGVADEDAGAQTGGTLMDVALDQQGMVAREFLDGLLQSLGRTAQVAVTVPDDDTVDIQVDGEDLGLLIGSKGATLLAVQDLTRTVVQRKTNAGNGRIFVDVAGYRRKRNEALARFAEKVAADVLASDTSIALEPMSAPDRKTVHDSITAIDGVETRSEGEDAARHVVVLPAGH